MNLLALLIFLLTGFFSDWGNAFWLLGGYALGLFVAGMMQASGRRF